MAIKPILGNVPPPPDATVAAAPKHTVEPTQLETQKIKTPTTKQPVAIQQQLDTVQLSGAALAKSLKLSGKNPSQIAVQMGVDIKTIDRYLDIATKSETTTIPPSNTVTSGVKQGVDLESGK